MSDLHVGEGLFRAELLRAAIAETNELGPDLVVVAGDLTMEGYRSEFEACKRSWASSRARTLSWRSARQVERGLLRVVEDEHAGQPAVDALGRLAMQVRMAPERRGWPVDRSSPGSSCPRLGRLVLRRRRQAHAVRAVVPRVRCARHAGHSA